MNAARRAGEDIIDLGMGNPDLPTPPHVVEKICEAARNPRNHRYSASRGIPNLRAAICEWYQRRHGVELDPDSEAIAVIGAKEGLSHFVLDDDRPGRRRAVSRSRVSDPPVLGDHRGRRPAPRAARARRATSSRTSRWRSQRTWPKPKMLIVSFPHNPTTHGGGPRVLRAHRRLRDASTT